MFGGIVGEHMFVRELGLDRTLYTGAYIHHRKFLHCTRHGFLLPIAPGEMYREYLLHGLDVLDDAPPAEVHDFRKGGFPNHVRQLGSLVDRSGALYALYAACWNQDTKMRRIHVPKRHLIKIRIPWDHETLFLIDDSDSIWDDIIETYGHLSRCFLSEYDINDVLSVAETAINFDLGPGTIKIYTKEAIIELLQAYDSAVADGTI